MEYVSLGRLFWAFALVLGLLGVLAVLARRYGSTALRVKPKTEARLEILESLPLDPRSRLLLIRRDNVEHLIVKSGEHTQVLETGIPHKRQKPQTIQEDTHDDHAA